MKKILILILSLFMISLSFGATLNNADIYYSYDATDTSGNAMGDISGNNNNGTCFNMVGANCNTVQGLLINASDFNGSNDYINTNSFINTINGSVSIWINATSFGGSGKYVLSDRSAAGDYMFIFITDTGTVRYRISSGGTNTIDSSITINTSEWNYITATWGSNGMELYINNKLKGSNAYTGDWTENTDMLIGETANAMATFTFDGLIDETAFYSRQLNSSERTQSYNSHSAFNPYDIPPPPTTSNAFEKITFLDELIINDTTTNLNDLYWNVELNQSLGLENFSINLDAGGFEKIQDLPLGNKIITDYTKVSSQEDVTGFIRYNNTIYVATSDNINLAYNQILIFDNDYETILQTVNLTSLPTPSGENDKQLSDIALKDDIFYLLTNNGLLHSFNNQLVDLNITYNLSALANNTPFTGKTQGIFYDGDLNRWVHGVASDREWHIYNEDFTKYLGMYSVSNDAPLNTEINRYTSLFNNSYYMYGNDKVFKLNKNFVYLNKSYTVLNFSEADTCNSVFQASFRFTEGEFIGLCRNPKADSNKLQFQRFYNNLSLIESNYTTTYGVSNLTDGSHTIQFRTQNNTNIFNTSIYTFTIDATVPVISDSLPLEINTYFINVSNYVSCSDTNLKTCNITFTPDGNTILVNQTALYEFTYNGNQSYNIIAEDQAGNIVNQSGVILINPIALYQFNDSGTLLTDYTFGGIFFNTTIANITFYNSILSVGSNNTLVFSKLGYITQNFTTEILNTSKINTTYNVSASEINVIIYYRTNGTLLIGTNISVVIEGLASGITDNGTITFRDALFTAGIYSVTASAEGFFTESKDFTYNAQESINVSLYMLETDNNFSSTLFVNIVDSFTHFLPNANVKLEEFDIPTQSWKDIGQCLTNSNGQCEFLVEVGSKKYRIYGSKIINGILQEKYSQILGEIFQPEISNGELVFGNPIIRSLSLESTPKVEVPIFSELYIDYPYDSNETIGSVNSTSYIVNFDVSFEATNNIDYTVCLEFYRVGNFGEEYIDKECTTGSSGTVPLFNYELDRDYTNRIKLTASQGNNYQVIKEYDYPLNDSLFALLNKDNYVPTTILLAWISLLVISLYARQIVIFIVGSFFISIVQFGFFPSFINLAGTILNIVIGFSLFNMARKKEDNL